MLQLLLSVLFFFCLNNLFFFLNSLFPLLHLLCLLSVILPLSSPPHTFIRLLSLLLGYMSKTS